MVNLLSGEMYLKTILENYLNERQTKLKIPEPLLIKKTNCVEDPGAFTYAKDISS
jgi:hypothetical protein